MTAILSALERLDRAIDRNREIKKIREIQKSGDKTDLKDKGKTATAAVMKANSTTC